MYILIFASVGMLLFCSLQFASHYKGVNKLQKTQLLSIFTFFIVGVGGVLLGGNIPFLSNTIYRYIAFITISMFLCGCILQGISSRRK